MKTQTSQNSSGKRIRGLFCVGLAAILAVAVAFGGLAANSRAPSYDVTVRSSFTHTAVLSGSDLYFWGTNDDGQFPNSDLFYSAEPVKLLSNVEDVAVSQGRTLVVSGGALRSYGRDPVTGELFDTNGTLLAHEAAQVAASDTFAAYISKDGALYTWGLNTSGQLGSGSTDAAEGMVQLFESGVKKVSLGDLFGLALMEDGKVYGWGVNSALETGYEKEEEDTSVLLTPQLVTDDVADISTGANHSCILKKDGSLWTCGSNLFSQTGVKGRPGNGLIRILTGIRSVSAGSQHNFAVSNDGAVYAWGYGVSGQLGQESKERIEQPRETTFDYVSVFACYDNTFGISSDGSLYSFGNNTNYLLGKSNGSDSLVPARILDKNMNWVYEDDGSGDVIPPAPSRPDSKNDGPEETQEPEIVSTPFIGGYGNGVFKPEDHVTRAEFLKMLVSALCPDFDPSHDYGASSFSDIPLNSWYEKYISYAEQQDLIHGYSDGTFRPDQKITRADASIMAAAALDLDLSKAPDAGYKDVPASFYAVSAINALTANGALTGDGDGVFRPNHNIKRCEAASLIAKAAGFKPSDAECKALQSQFTKSPFTDVSADKWYYAYVLRGVGYVK